jgi:hypothetical protein
MLFVMACWWNKAMETGRSRVKYLEERDLTQRSTPCPHIVPEVVRCGSVPEELMLIYGPRLKAGGSAT